MGQGEWTRQLGGRGGEKDEKPQQMECYVCVVISQTYQSRFLLLLSRPPVPINARSYSNELNVNITCIRLARHHLAEF